MKSILRKPLWLNNAMRERFLKKLIEMPPYNSIASFWHVFMHSLSTVAENMDTTGNTPHQTY